LLKELDQSRNKATDDQELAQKLGETEIKAKGAMPEKDTEI